MTYVVGLEECQSRPPSVIGGKAAGLGALVRERLPVPPGFVLVAGAYREFVAQTRLEGAIRSLDGADTLADAAQASMRIRDALEQHELAGAVGAELSSAYTRIGGPVAVRSSAIGEDGTEASFAGEYESVVGVRGTDAVARAVVRCWSSLFTPQAIAYRDRLGMPPADCAMAVIVQALVPAEAAGVMLTIDPITGDRSQIVIEGCLGLGLPVVSGEATPDRFAVDKVTLEIRARSLAPKRVAYRFDPGLDEVRAVAVPVDEQDRSCLADDEVVELARLGKSVERALGLPQDIEWALGPDRPVQLLQTRPETVWSRHARPKPGLSPPNPRAVPVSRPRP